MSSALLCGATGAISPPLSVGSSTDSRCTASQLMARCLALMDLRPAVCIAPAPRTNWHV